MILNPINLSIIYEKFSNRGVQLHPLHLSNGGPVYVIVVNLITHSLATYETIVCLILYSYKVDLFGEINQADIPIQINAGRKYTFNEKLI